MRLPGQQTLGRCEVISINLVTARIDIDSDELVFIFRTKGGVNIPIIDLLPPSREVFEVAERVVWIHLFLQRES